MPTPPDNDPNGTPPGNPAEASPPASPQASSQASPEGSPEAFGERAPEASPEGSPEALREEASEAPSEPPPASLPASSPLEPPALVLELAAACVRYVERALGVALDYTPDTLSLLDHYVRAGGPELAAKPEARHLVASTLGAYFGEVIRRHYGSTWWHAPGADPAAWQLRFDGVYLALVPFAFASAALDDAAEGGEEGGLLLDDAEREEIAERLAALPPLDPDEYRLLTTRYDVIEIVVDHLRARVEAQNLGDVRLSDEDYDA